MALLHHPFWLHLIFRHFWGINFQPFVNYFVWLRITDEGSVSEMRIWSILLIRSDLKLCMHLSRSLFLFFSTNNIALHQLHSWVAVVIPTDRLKSVRNRVLEVLGGVLVLSCCCLDFSVGIGAFVIGLSHISSFFSLQIIWPVQYYMHEINSVSIKLFLKLQKLPFVVVVVVVVVLFFFCIMLIYV